MKRQKWSFRGKRNMQGNAGAIGGYDNWRKGSRDAQVARTEEVKAWAGGWRGSNGVRVWCRMAGARRHHGKS
jgi:hypothetical protein